MYYAGDFAVGQVVMLFWNTFSSNDPAASVTMTDFVTGDAHVHKDDSLTQRASTTGQTVDVDIDGIAGSHWVKIDTADNTTADFYEAGHDYFVRIEGVTIDSGTVNAIIGCFSIANRRTAGQMAVTSIEGLTDQNTFTLTSGEASPDDDAYNDCLCIVTDQTTKIQKAIGYISDYTGSTRSVQLYASPLCTGFTMAVADSVEIFSSSAFTNVHTVSRTAQTAGDIPALVVTADAAIDVAVADLANGTDGLGALKTLIDASDVVVDAIKVVTDKFVFTVANQVDANTLQIEGADATDAINAACDAALDTAIAELSVAAPTATPTMRTGLMLLYMALRNKTVVQTSGTDALEIYNDAGTKIAAKLLTDDGSDYTEAEMA